MVTISSDGQHDGEKPLRINSPTTHLTKCDTAIDMIGSALTAPIRLETLWRNVDNVVDHLKRKLDESLKYNHLQTEYMRLAETLQDAVMSAELVAIYRA